MYLALYRKFRPETFDGMLGQEHIVRILTNQINGGTTGHAYLFCGTRGTGKTSAARLLAKGVNCLSEGARPCGACASCDAIRDGVFVDVIEIDAASNNGVENIRELRESVKYPPALGRRKVYIIDEVHMLSGGAFNALLKTLEEPPESVMFVLATTEPQKLPATILSRCLRLDFRRVPAAVIGRGMRDICDRMGVAATDEALALLASNADGSVRDGLSLLDQCVSSGEKAITRDTVLDLLGSPGEEGLLELTRLTASGDASGALLLLDRLLAEGRDERQLMKDWLEHFRNLMLIRHLKRPQDMMNMSGESIERLREQGAGLSAAFINDSIFGLAKILNDARWFTRPRVLLEVGMIRMASPFAAGDTARAAPAAPPVPQPEDTTRAAQAVQQPEDTTRATPAVQQPEAATPAAPAVPQPEDTTRAARTAPAAGPDLTETWISAVTEAGKSKPTAARLIGRSSLTGIGDGVFTVEVFDRFSKGAAEGAAGPLEAAMERIAGAALKMECRLNEGGRPPRPAKAPTARRQEAEDAPPDASPPEGQLEIGFAE
jgi:DNA polymerase-3 subunit gamma/tau